jgi:hypothetical protein
MDIIEIKTLVDITNTEVRRINQGTQLELDQFRNWTTLLQCIGMRAIISYDRNPTVETIDINGLGFGSRYKGRHQVWTFQFRPERDDAFADNGDPTILLYRDMDKIPVILNLTESINIDIAVFDLTDPERINSIIKAH